MTKSQEEMKVHEGEHLRQDLKYLLDRLDDQIHMELELIGHRMNVLVVSQAFLFAAYTTDLLAKGDKSVKIENALLWIIPVVGALTCAIIGVSLIVALVVIRRRKFERDKVRDKLRDAMVATSLKNIAWGSTEILEHVSCGTVPHRSGNYPPLLLPPVILVAWAYLFHVMSISR